MPFAGVKSSMSISLPSFSGIQRRLRQWIYSIGGVKFGGKAWLQSIEIPRNLHDISLGANASLDNNVTLIATGSRGERRRIVIGERVYVNRFTIIDASESIVIGDDCMIGPFCYITDHDHGRDVGSTVGESSLVSSAVTIEHNVWIGAHVTILKGVHIHQGATIGAGAVVTRDVGAHETVAGVPAKPLRAGR